MHLGYVEIQGLGYGERRFASVVGGVFVLRMRYWELGDSISDSGFVIFVFWSMYLIGNLV